VGESNPVNGAANVSRCGGWLTKSTIGPFVGPSTGSSTSLDTGAARAPDGTLYRLGAEPLAAADSVATGDRGHFLEAAEHRLAKVAFEGRLTPRSTGSQPWISLHRKSDSPGMWFSVARA
jgi:hypothetical protein